MHHLTRKLQSLNNGLSSWSEAKGAHSAGYLCSPHKTVIATHMGSASAFTIEGLEMGGCKCRAHKKCDSPFGPVQVGITASSHVHFEEQNRYSLPTRRRKRWVGNIPLVFLPISKPTEWGVKCSSRLTLIRASSQLTHNSLTGRNVLAITLKFFLRLRNTLIT